MSDTIQIVYFAKPPGVKAPKWHYSGTLIDGVVYVPCVTEPDLLCALADGVCLFTKIPGRYVPLPWMLELTKENLNTPGRRAEFEELLNDVWPSFDRAIRAAFASVPDLHETAAA